MDLKRPSYQRTDEAILILLAVVIFTVVGTYSFTGQRAISQKPNDICSKTVRLALEYIENCWSGVLSVAFSCLEGQILVQKFTKFDNACITTRTK